MYNGVYGYVETDQGHLAGGAQYAIVVFHHGRWGEWDTWEF